MLEALSTFVESSGIGAVILHFGDQYKYLIMVAIACLLLYLAIVKGFEPLLLIPIAFGMLLSNLPLSEMFMTAEQNNGTEGLLHIFYKISRMGVFPPLIFLGIGAMTDFGPLIANPKSLLLGAAAQFGIFLTFFLAIIFGFNAQEAGSIGIIGGADGPTAILVTSILAPDLLASIAVAAYSYMALVPVIQPPIMKALTTKEERCIVMKQLRPVSQKEKILFPIIVTIIVGLIVPTAIPLVGMLMLGNLFKESGATSRLSEVAQNALCNIVTIMLGTAVGSSAMASTFLTFKTIKIIIMGVIAFGGGTAMGVLIAKLMNLFSKKENRVNPLIGSAGVSAVPMAARVSQVVGQKENPSNFLLMHAMGPNVSGVIGSAVAAGVLIALFRV